MNATVRMVGRRTAARPTARSVDALPLVLLFMNLIPLLLLGLNLTPVHAEVVALTGKWAAPGNTLRLLVTLRPSLFVVEAQGGALPTARLRQLTVRIARGADGGGLQRLSQALRELKGRFPACDTVTLMPEASVPYEEVVGVMNLLHQRRMTAEADHHLEPMFANVLLGSGKS